jgi:hypothetical protein
MKAVTNNEEAAPWSRSNHLMGTRCSPQVMTGIMTYPYPETFAKPELR